MNRPTSTSPRVPPTLGAALQISTSNVSRPHKNYLINTQDDSDDEEDTSDESEDDESENDESENDESEDDDAILHEDFAEFKRRVRVEETGRAEGNRRAGGLKTQKAMVKAWQASNNFLPLLFINYSLHRSLSVSPSRRAKYKTTLLTSITSSSTFDSALSDRSAVDKVLISQEHLSVR